MSAHHTPGPWRAGPVFQKDGRAIFFSDASLPGRWQRRLDDKTGVFAAADARLMAAAPELLEALQDLHDQVVAFCDRHGEADFETGRAAAAIAQAGGQEGGAA